MIPEAELRRIETRTRNSVRYPAWYPSFLRGDEVVPTETEAEAARPPAHAKASQRPLLWRAVPLSREDE